MTRLDSYPSESKVLPEAGRALDGTPARIRVRIFDPPITAIKQHGKLDGQATLLYRSTGCSRLEWISTNWRQTGGVTGLGVSCQLTNNAGIMRIRPGVKAVSPPAFKQAQQEFQLGRHWFRGNNGNDTGSACACRYSLMEERRGHRAKLANLKTAVFRWYNTLKRSLSRPTRQLTVKCHPQITDRLDIKPLSIVPIFTVSIKTIYHHDRDREQGEKVRQAAEKLRPWIL